MFFFSAFALSWDIFLNELILKLRLKPEQVYTHKNWQIMAMVTSHSISRNVNNAPYAAARLK